VREYLDSLTWDGVPRLSNIATDILGAEDTPIHRTLVRKFAISAVRRIKHPGQKADEMLILYGNQGALKSTFVQTLASPAWFTDTAIDFSDATSLMIGGPPENPAKSDAYYLWTAWTTLSLVETYR